MVIIIFSVGFSLQVHQVCLCHWLQVTFQSFRVFVSSLCFLRSLKTVLFALASEDSALTWIFYSHQSCAQICNTNILNTALTVINIFLTNFWTASVFYCKSTARLSHNFWGICGDSEAAWWFCASVVTEMVCYVA